MEIKGVKSTINYDGVNNVYNQNFARIVVSIIDKGIDNPAFQLHILSMLFAGRPFYELIGNEKEDVSFINLVKRIPDVLKNDLVGEEGLTIEEFLKKFQKREEE